MNNSNAPTTGSNISFDTLISSIERFTNTSLKNSQERWLSDLLSSSNCFNGRGGSNTVVTPTLSAMDVSGNEDSKITLKINNSVSNSKESVYTLITGLPAGAKLSEGTYVSFLNGWVIEGSDVKNVKLTPPDDYSGELKINVMAIGTVNNKFAVTTTSFDLVVNEIADKPTLTVHNAHGYDNGPIDLHISGKLTDSSGEKLTYKILGVPADATLNHGVRNADGSWTLSASDVVGLQLTERALHDNLKLTVQAISTVTTGANAGTTAITTKILSVDIDHMKFVPVVVVSAVSGNEDTVIAIDENHAVHLDVKFLNKEGQDYHHHGHHYQHKLDNTVIKISGLPAGATLNHGVLQSDGSYVLHYSDLAGLTLIPPANFSGDIDLNVVATFTKGIGWHNQTFTSIPVDLHIDIKAVADAPTLNVVNAVGDEDTTISLSSKVHAMLTDTDGSETLAIRISGVPAGASMTGAVYDAAHGYWVVTNLALLAITPAANTYGVYNLTITAISTESSNNSTASVSSNLELTVNRVLIPPVIDVGSGPVVDGNHVINVGSTQISGTADVGVTINIISNGSVIVGSVVADAGGHWSFDVGNALGNGSYTLVAVAHDPQSPVSPASGGLSVVIDITPPNAPIINEFSHNSGSMVDHITNDNMPVLSGTAEANAVVTVLDGGVALGTVIADGSGHWTFAMNGLSEGDHALTAYAKDMANNTSVVSSPFIITVDTIAPNAPVIAGFGNDSGLPLDHITNDNMPVLSGTAEANAVVTVMDGTLALGTALADGMGHWTFAVTGALSDGDHIFTAYAKDIADNTSAVSSALAIKIDTAIEVPVIIGFTDDTGTVGDHATLDNTPQLMGTAEANAVVTIVEDHSITLGTAIADELGNWTFQVDSLTANTNYIFDAFAQDVAGNQSVSSSDFEISILGATPPSALVVNDPNIPTELTADLSSVLITGNASSGVHITDVDSNTTIASGIMPSMGGAWNFNDLVLHNGLNHLDVSDGLSHVDLFVRQGLGLFSGNNGGDGLDYTIIVSNSKDPVTPPASLADGADGLTQHYSEVINVDGQYGIVDVGYLNIVAGHGGLGGDPDTTVGSVGGLDGIGGGVSTVGGGGGPSTTTGGGIGDLPNPTTGGGVGGLPGTTTGGGVGGGTPTTGGGGVGDLPGTTTGGGVGGVPTETTGGGAGSDPSSGGGSPTTSVGTITTYTLAASDGGAGGDVVFNQVINGSAGNDIIRMHDISIVGGDAGNPAKNQGTIDGSGQYITPSTLDGFGGDGGSVTANISVDAGDGDDTIYMPDVELVHGTSKIAVLGGSASLTHQSEGGTANLSEIFMGGAGKDTFFVGNVLIGANNLTAAGSTTNSFSESIDGGSDIDTLSFANVNAAAIDLMNGDNGVYSNFRNIEVLDLGSNKTLNIDDAAIANYSATSETPNTLIIKGDSTDSLNLYIHGSDVVTTPIDANYTDYAFTDSMNNTYHIQIDNRVVVNVDFMKSFSVEDPNSVADLGTSTDAVVLSGQASTGSTINILENNVVIGSVVAANTTVAGHITNNGWSFADLNLTPGLHHLNIVDATNPNSAIDVVLREGAKVVAGNDGQSGLDFVTVTQSITLPAPSPLPDGADGVLVVYSENISVNGVYGIVDAGYLSVVAGHGGLGGDPDTTIGVGDGGTPTTGGGGLGGLPGGTTTGGGVGDGGVPTTGGGGLPGTTTGGGVPTDTTGGSTGDGSSNSNTPVNPGNVTTTYTLAGSDGGHGSDATYNQNIYGGNGNDIIHIHSVSVTAGDAGDAAKGQGTIDDLGQQITPSTLDGFGGAGGDAFANLYVHTGDGNNIVYMPDVDLHHGLTKVEVIGGMASLTETIYGGAAHLTATFIGGAGDDTFYAGNVSLGTGNYFDATVNGGLGDDSLSFQRVANGVSVDFENSLAGNYAIQSIEEVTGSNFNDTFTIGNLTAFNHINGGSGFDTVRLGASGVLMDMSDATHADDKFLNISAFDLGNGKSNSIQLDDAAIEKLATKVDVTTGVKTLFINGDSSDSIYANLSTQGYSHSTAVINSQSYDVYVNADHTAALAVNSMVQNAGSLVNMGFQPTPPTALPHL